MKPTTMTEAEVQALQNAINNETLAETRAKYEALCDERDAINAKVEPIQVKLDAANTEAEAARVKAAALADEIEELWGADWLKLKKSISLRAGRIMIAKRAGL